ncbi:hypothetical protein, partial [Salibaculum halophilum]|uniref:hypothetical protein n=1 Tax=Salibaculum halophilum TaxID=1914408 RepID=UPI001C4F407D
HGAGPFCVPPPARWPGAGAGLTGGAPRLTLHPDPVSQTPLAAAAKAVETKSFRWKVNRLSKMSQNPVE